MRKTSIFASAGVVLALSAGAASAMGGGNLSPSASPYAIIVPQATFSGNMREGRSAYEGANGGPSAFFGQPDNRPSIAPQESPEDRTYYSRGR